MAESEKLMKIAVDAMGGDYAPGIVVEGVTQALYDYPDCEFTLVGHTGKLGFYLQKYGIADHPRRNTPPESGTTGTGKNRP